MALSDEVRKGVVQAEMTGPVTRGAWGILTWEVLIFACLVGHFFHSAIVGCIIFFGFLFFIGSRPLYTIISVSVGLGIAAFWVHLHDTTHVYLQPQWLDSILIFFQIFFVSLIINGLLLLFAGDLF